MINLPGLKTVLDQCIECKRWMILYFIVKLIDWKVFKISSRSTNIYSSFLQDNSVVYIYIWICEPILWDSFNYGSLCDCMVGTFPDFTTVEDWRIMHSLRSCLFIMLNLLFLNSLSGASPGKFSKYENWSEKLHDNLPLFSYD